MGFLSKAKQSDKKFISVDQIYFYCIFVKKKVWQKYCSLMLRKNGFVEFHHFMKIERLNNSSKTFLISGNLSVFVNCKQKK